MIFGGSTSSVWRCSLRLYLSLDCEEEDHGRTGEGGAPSAPSVPVPRPVARGLADRRQVRMQLIASFTHGALNPLRICAHITFSKKKYSFVLFTHFLTVMSVVQVCERVGIFYSQLCSSAVVDAANSVPCVRRRLLLIL